ncbi:MAG: cysteine methyltransferase [Stygiobacter sp. RIFOXYC12_FULL_38_8]|nr:MAG: cysteine methyltransferase [Stygiobacter sp. RIFOXYA12_FULL_38_9]OGV06065.1 MAG: cysteine methyltransferase [Stygiobacter sp. RIFOXYB2_FULL_37_11]OGV10190.1 MAG: cysteine methyltransferase [Stygiobacter sp. RIFOXYA2_FULL_38_8]OGV16871.1 MAG: cysteine methyltransferase [Stygiobacter sp. RIFOXYC2_FULL_38_25]OGV28498.1 MAG: cysteine methyltransferase [Stygiobacter sp. RIFOXYC12_FULL_38_8]OGV82778.1 MAG: cysteine methyltransferase [Stygiobacter sp. GWF2_38_21]RJQ57236.1 MAG: methylated-DN
MKKNPENKVYKAYLNSPIGLIEITGIKDAILKVSFVEDKFETEFKTNNYVNECALQLEQYFNGGRKEFELNLEPEGTEFQRKVWDELLKIPFGYTKSYLFISKMIGDTLAIRAAAKANGQNPIAIIIPCHRVIGSDGSLTGYAGGLWRKKWLLEHEQKFSDGEKQMELLL